MATNLFGLDQYFYHGSVKRYVSLFGSLFSEVYIKRKADESDREDTIKIPIRYGSGNMYSKVAQGATRETMQVSRILPAMAFELDNIYKDQERKTNPMNRIQAPTFTNTTPETKSFQLNRIPYNFLFFLRIRTKNTDDMLQIVEQIVPQFDGNLSVTIEDTTGVPVEQDIIISLEEIHMEDNYDEEMQSRLIEWKITFTLRGFLYKRTQTGLIVRAIDLESGTNFNNMQLVETINIQNPIESVQNVLADFTDVFNSASAPPAKKITRKRKK